MEHCGTLECCWNARRGLIFKRCIKQGTYQQGRSQLGRSHLGGTQLGRPKLGRETSCCNVTLSEAAVCLLLQHCHRLQIPACARSIMIIKPRSNGLRAFQKSINEECGGNVVMLKKDQIIGKDTRAILHSARGLSHHKPFTQLYTHSLAEPGSSLPCLRQE